jgi:hypothetical protein
MRKVTALVLLLVFPAAVGLAESSGGMLYSNGTTWLNGTSVPRSSAVFPGDTIQTQPGAAANVAANGARMVIHPDSVVRYQANGVLLEHGGVLVTTSKSATATAHGVTVKPATSALTEYEVVENNGAVQVSAHKGDVLIADASGAPALVLQQGGASTTQPPDAIPGGTSPKKQNFFTTPAGIALIGGAALAIILAVALSGGGSHSTTTPVSASSPAGPVTP